MFTIEHEFDCTVVTLLDHDTAHLQEDVVITSFDDCVTVEQYDPHTGHVQKVTLSMAQVTELAASLALPEGAYTHDLV
jgi:hypothetical protein